MSNTVRLILFSCLMAFAVCKPQGFYTPNLLVYSGANSPTPGPQNFVPILRYSASDNAGDGSYQYAYESGNGISVHENGRLNPSAREGAAVVADGGFSFTGVDGHTYSISYVADENGFRPVGAHIPTPPPIPEAIARSLQTLPRLDTTGTLGQYQIIANRY